MLVRPLKTNWRWSLEMTMLFLHVAPPHQRPTLSINALTPCCWKRGVGLRTDVCQPPFSTTASCQHLKWSKLSFPPTCPVYWLLSSRAARPLTHILSVTIGLIECDPPPARPMTWIEGRGTGKQLVIQTLPGGFTLNIVWRMFPKRVSLCELSSHPRNYFL